MLKTIFVPSGDQRGWMHLWRPGRRSARRRRLCLEPDLAQPASVGVNDPQRLRLSELTRRENTIAFPCGDQSPHELTIVPGGVIGADGCRRLDDVQADWIALLDQASEDEPLAVGRVVAGKVLAARDWRSSA